jgi:hypothetical protein
MHYGRWYTTGEVGQAAPQNDGSAARQMRSDCGERPVGPKGGRGLCLRCSHTRSPAVAAELQREKAGLLTPSD